MPVTLDLLSPAPATGGAALPSSPATTTSVDAGMSFGRALADARRATPAPEENRPPEAGPDAARAAGSRPAAGAPRETGAQDAAATDGPAADAPAAGQPEAGAAGEPADAASAGDDDCAGDEPPDAGDARARAAAEVLAELGLIPLPPTPASAAPAVPGTPATGADSGPQARAAMVLMQMPAAPEAAPAETLAAGDAAQAAADPDAPAFPSLQPPPAEAGARQPVGLPGEAPPPEQDALSAVQKMAAALMTAAPGGRTRAAAADAPLPPLTDAGTADDLPPEPLAVPLPPTRKPAAADGPATVPVPVPGHVAQALAAAGQSVQAPDISLAGQPAAPAPEAAAADAAPASATPATTAAAAAVPAPVAADAGLNPAGVRGATASDAQAVPAPQAPLPVANPRAWAPLLGQHLMHLVQTGDTQATVRVNPPQLGPVELRLELKDSLTHVSFYAHDAQVREALEQSLPRLRELLGAQGLQLGQSHVGDQASQQQQQQPNPDGGSMAGSGDRRGNGRNDGMSGRDETVVVSGAEVVLPVRKLLGGVDHYV